MKRSLYLFISCIFLTVVYSIAGCVDSETYKFETMNKGKIRKRGCSWLMPQDTTKAKKRRKRFCEWVYSNGSWIREECPRSCQVCITDSPTPNPTISSAPTYPDCYDQKYFRFPTVQYVDAFTTKTVVRNCEWLTRHPKKTALRISTYCNETNKHGFYVRDYCQLTCGSCPTEAPSQLPTTTPPSPMPTTTPPSPMPTVTPPSPMPTSASPTETPDCYDDTSFEIETVKHIDKFTHEIVNKKCSWLTREEDKTNHRISRYCDQMNSNGLYVRDYCISSCDNCPCADSSTYTFYTYLKGEKVDRKCSWLTVQESKAADRITKFCHESFNGYKVEEKCRLSCNMC